MPPPSKSKEGAGSHERAWTAFTPHSGMASVHEALKRSSVMPAAGTGTSRQVEGRILMAREKQTQKGKPEQRAQNGKQTGAPKITSEEQLAKS